MKVFCLPEECWFLANCMKASGGRSNFVQLFQNKTKSLCWNFACTFMALNEKVTKFHKKIKCDVPNTTGGLKAWKKALWFFCVHNFCMKTLCIQAHAFCMIVVRLANLVNTLYFQSRIAHMFANLCFKFCTVVSETYFISVPTVLREMTINQLLLFTVPNLLPVKHKSIIWL